MKKPNYLLWLSETYGKYVLSSEDGSVISILETRRPIYSLNDKLYGVVGRYRYNELHPDEQIIPLEFLEELKEYIVDLL